MPLHALLVIYDGFDMARLDETVELIESVFLPDLREDGGLFGYFGISDGVDKTVALRIMDSEESLQRGSDIAADFVAEHLGDWLPDDPLQVSGSLAVAALAGVHMGENLAGAMPDDSVFASVRVYDGIDPADQSEIARLTAAGFLPIMRESDGFVGYYLMPAGDSLAAISLFDSSEQAAASTERAREFVVENLAPLLPNAPTVVEGPLSIYQVAALSGAEGIGGDGELYASIRFYTGFDLTHFDEANELAKAQLLLALQELGGMFAQFALNDGEDMVVGISIFDSEAASLAANDVGKAFTMEYIADWAPNPPTGPSGKLAIAAKAEINGREPGRRDDGGCRKKQEIQKRACRLARSSFFVLIKAVARPREKRHQNIRVRFVACSIVNQQLHIDQGIKISLNHSLVPAGISQVER